MEKVRIVINNQKSRLVAPLKVRMQIRKIWGIKNKRAFWSPQYRKGQWDGYVRYLGEDSGLFSTGLLSQLLKHLDHFKVKYKLEDSRGTFKDMHEVSELGGMEFRDYQFGGVRSLLNNRVEGIRYQRGIFNDATNAGKLLMAGGVIASFSNKRVSLFLINNKTLFEQAYRDMVKLFGKEQVGRVNSEHTEWKRINICMVQTLGNRMRKDPRYKNMLAKADIVLMDEADEVIGRKDAQSVLTYAANATVRAAFTGTAGKHKDPLRNQELIAYFGPIIHSITNKELVDLGVSTPPDIRITMGNKEVRRDDDYKYEYEHGIVSNQKRHKRVWKRVIKHFEKGRLPMIILFKQHRHGYALLAERPMMLDNLRIKLIHHETPNREAILKEFNAGKIDILLASMIIKRGSNLPRIKVLLNAAGGDSEGNVLQVLGRLLRSHKSKKKVYMEDFWDIGRYLQRHSRHRVIYYKNQDFKIKELYKKHLAILNKKSTI